MAICSSGAALPLAVLFDESDVAALAPASAAFVALTPPARLAAERRGLAAASSRQRYSDGRHARSALREFDQAPARGELPPAVRLMARHSAWQLSLIATRLAFTLPAAPCLLRDASGQWIETAERTRQLEIMLPRILDAGLAHRL